MSSWGDRTTSDLVTFLEGAMPPGNPGSLGELAYINVTAFILDFNGARPGNQPLTAASKVAIRSVASGQIRAQGLAERGGRTTRWPGRSAGSGDTPRLVVAGEVKNYTPVTDAMLRNPDPSDWLMIRHDYHATNYSPLNQITTQNVKDLQLQWVWAMNEGTNQPAPVVHNGVMYLNNPGNIVQALDARKGDLIWENRIGPTATGNSQRGPRDL